MDPDHSKVAIMPISQATRATFSDLFFRVTFLFFIQTGSKRILNSPRGEVVGEEGDLLIFPPGSMVTMENRPLPDADYRAVGVSFTDDLVDAVFTDRWTAEPAPGVQVIRATPDRPIELLPLIRDTLDNPSLPEAIRRHRLLEPLIWLKDRGYHVPPPREDSPLGRIRGLIETDLSHAWRAADVARHLAMSEATMRRWLSRTGFGFAKILLHSRLEHGLTLLQTTDIPISRIALDCGFSTPSHFSDAFRKRFGIPPKEIRSADT